MRLANESDSLAQIFSMRWYPSGTLEKYSHMRRNSFTLASERPSSVVIRVLRFMSGFRTLFFDRTHTRQWVETQWNFLSTRGFRSPARPPAGRLSVSGGLVTCTGWLFLRVMFLSDYEGNAGSPAFDRRGGTVVHTCRHAHDRDRDEGTHFLAVPVGIVFLDQLLMMWCAP